MGKTVSLLILCLLAICMLAFPSIHVKPVYAAATTVSVTNASTGSNTTIASLHDNFTLNVTIENSPANLGGYQFTLVWNASILNCTSYTITPPQEWDSNWYAARNKLNRTNPDGTQSYYTVVVSTAGEVSVGPNHVINTFNFTVIGKGETELQFPPLAAGHVVLGDWYGNNIPATAVSGLFETIFSPIYIRADGSISPSSAPIQRNGSIYTLTGNITSSASGIIVQKSNITIDGAGYTLGSNGSGNLITHGYGFNLTGINHVVIKNMKVTNYKCGIWLFYSSDNSVSRSNVANNFYGISLEYSSNNSISGNNVANSTSYGIEVYAVSNNTISDNDIVNNAIGIVLQGTTSNNTVFGNNITNNGDGIDLAYSYSTNLSENNIAANSQYGIYLDSSYNNTLSGNNITHAHYGVFLTISNHNSIIGNNVKANGGYGIYLEKRSTYNNVSGNNVTANGYANIGVYSNNNTLSGNIITNSQYGILLASSNNTIYRNYFINNTNQAYSYNLTNVWDDGSKGNYWSDYSTKYPNATEIDSSGIWNTSYVIDANNTDHYPLMNQPIIPEFSLYLMLPLMMMATLLTVIIYRRKHGAEAISI